MNRGRRYNAAVKGYRILNERRAAKKARLTKLGGPDDGCAKCGRCGITIHGALHEDYPDGGLMCPSCERVMDEGASRGRLDPL